MNMRATTLGGIAEDAPTMSEAQRNWRIAAIALLSTRFIQGFIIGRRLAPLHLCTVQAGPKRAELDGEQVPDSDAGSFVRHGSSDQLHVDAFLLALCRRHSVQRCRAHRRSDAHDGATDSRCGTVLHGFSVLLMAMFVAGATCIDEWTMAACNLAMGASLLLAAAAPIRSTTSCFTATPPWPENSGSAGCRAASIAADG